MNSNAKEIRYLNRDFNSTLRRLVDYTKYYYPNSFNDFSPSSPAMIILELIAYGCDVLNFYIDKQTKESILYYATQKQSVYNIAQSYGYRIKTAIPAAVSLSFECIVPTSSVTPGEPDYNYAPVLYPGTIVNSKNFPNSYFTVLQTINFKDHNSNQILPTQIGNSQFSIIRKKVTGYSITQKTINITCDSIVNDNLKIYLPDSNVVQIVSVVDSNNKNWYQVLNLANDTVTDELQPEYTGTTTNSVRIFKRKKTNKRYKKVVDADGNTFLYFGSKLRSDKLESQLYEDFYKYNANQIATPSMLLLNNNYGEVPYSTILTIKYTIANDATVPANSIDTIVYKQDYNNDVYNSDLYNGVLSSMLVYNQSPSVGGQGMQSIQSIKQNAMATINTQNRLVTQQDYMNAVKMIPAEYGNIAKSYVKRNASNNQIELWVLSYDNQKKLTPTNDQIKQNIGQFLQRYRMLGDVIVIRDAYIINVACQFTIVGQKSYSKKQLLIKAIQAVKNFMSIQNREIGQPIDINLLRNQILLIQGISNVVELKFINRKGSGYSLVDYDMQNAYLKERGKYFTSYSPSIFELKQPDLDIMGSIL